MQLQNEKHRNMTLTLESGRQITTNADGRAHVNNKVDAQGLLDEQSGWVQVLTQFVPSEAPGTVRHATKEELEVVAEMDAVATEHAARIAARNGLTPVLVAVPVPMQPEVRQALALDAVRNHRTRADRTDRTNRDRTDRTDRALFAPDTRIETLTAREVEAREVEVGRAEPRQRRA